MPLVEKPGKYEGYVTDHSIVGKKSGAMQLECSCRVEMLDGAKLPKPLYIMAWLTIMKKDGTKNENQIKTLKKAFGWSGESLNELEALDVSTRRCKITVEMDKDLEGNDCPKVAWIDALSSVKKASPADMSSFEARWLGGQAAAQAAKNDCPI